MSQMRRMSSLGGSAANSRASLAPQRQSMAPSKKRQSMAPKVKSNHFQKCTLFDFNSSSSFQSY